MERIRTGRTNDAERNALAVLVGAVATAQRTIALCLTDTQIAAAWGPVTEQFAVLLPAFGPRVHRQDH